MKLVPWNYDFTKETYAALFISNGPGDPALATETISHIRQVALCSITDTPVPPSGVGGPGDPDLATETISHIRQVALCSITGTPVPPSGVGGWTWRPRPSNRDDLAHQTGSALFYHWHTCTPQWGGWWGDPALATETISHIRQVALCSITDTTVPPSGVGGPGDPDLATETISHIRQVALCSITGTPVPPSGVGGGETPP